MAWKLRFAWLSAIACALQSALPLGPAARAEYLAGGAQLTALTNDGQSRAAAWAWHGQWIACVRAIPGSALSQLFILRPDGSEDRPVSRVGHAMFAEWSWSGRFLAYEWANAADSESQGAVYIYDLGRNESVNISAPYLRGDMDPDDGPFWSHDDRYVIYKVRPGVARVRQLWVYEVPTAKTWRFLPERGEGKRARWSSAAPARVCLLLQAPGGWDAVTAEPDGGNLAQLGNIGAESLLAGAPQWSPADDWVTFTFNKDMSQTERESGRSDVWIARPDATQPLNLTRAASPVTEKQLNVGEPLWSWDGRWIICAGERFDIQGNEIPTLYLIDPQQQSYEILLTCQPRQLSQFEEFLAVKWSYDSTKIALLSERSTVRNWGPDAQYEKRQTALSLYDLRSRQRIDLVVLDDEQDRQTLLGTDDRAEAIETISWSPDSRCLGLTVAKIISKADNILQPDVYRLDLPEELIDPAASQQDGPPIGRGRPAEAQLPEAPRSVPEAATVARMVAATPETPADPAAVVTVTINPRHMTVQEAIESLPTKYGAYLTKNVSRNLMLFKGPANVLAELRQDLDKIDTPPPQILVDLLAVELTDEATRSLGLDWTYADGHIALFQPTGNAIRDLTPDGSFNGITTFPGAGQAFYKGVGRLPREFFIRLNALVQDDKGTILANPRTVATSGKEALIQIRKTLNYFFNEGYDTAGRPIVKKSDISADTQGKIVPTLLADNFIHMLVDIKVGSFTFTSAAQLPEQTSRESTTVVTVRDGETLVIGGLRQQEMTKSIAKVPILGDIPLLGGLFKKEQSQVRHTVLTLFITPHLLQDAAPTPAWPSFKTPMDGTLPSDFPQDTLLK